MVNVDDAFEIRYKKSGEQFEVLVDFDKLNEFKKKDAEISVYDVLADVKIFKDQKKGDMASPISLKKVFGTDNEEIILKEILLNGECQIPTAYLNKLREEKKLQVINYITENAINPTTKSKYTFSMIEGEVNKLKYNFKADVDFMIQAKDVLNSLKKVMPISISKVTVLIKVEGQYCGNFYGPFRKFGKITKESYDDTGNLHLHIEINESILDTVINYIKNNSNNSSEYVIEKNN